MQSPARAALLVDGEADTDAMQNWTVNSGVWSVTTNASCSDGEWRLETGRPRVSPACTILWRAKSGRWSVSARERGEEREAGEEARQCLDSTNLMTSGVGVCRFRRPNTRPGGEFLSGEKSERGEEE
jgi:hypothetical protein